MRWIGLDVGERRIGVALSDPLEITAQGHSVLKRVGLRKDLEELQKIIIDNEVTGLVLGLPVNMNGSHGPMTEKIRHFATALEKVSGLTPVFWDERLSTMAAQRVLIEADMSRSRRRETVDQVAATIILQNFLDNRAR